MAERSAPVLVVGGSGQLGRTLLGLLGERGVGVDLPELDMTDAAAVAQCLAAVRPGLVINTAARTDVDGCEAPGEAEKVWAVNAAAVGHLREASAAVGAHLVQLSTDFVFDGLKGSPYVETDATNPQCVYGASKLGGEEAAGPDATIVRTAWLFGDEGHNIVRTVLRLLDEGRTLSFVDDQLGCPTYATDLAPALVRLGDDRRAGIHHVTNSGSTSWFGLVHTVVELLGLPEDRVRPISTGELEPPQAARRPPDSRMDAPATRAAGLGPLPHHRDALERLLRGWGR